PISLGWTETLLVENSHVAYLEFDSTETHFGPDSYKGVVEQYTFSQGVLSLAASKNKTQNWVLPGRLCYIRRIGNYDPSDGATVLSMGSPFTIHDMWMSPSSPDNATFNFQTDLAAKPVGPSTNATVTISAANPAVVTWNSHGLIANTPVVFSTTGTLPSPLLNIDQGFQGSATYWVLAAGLTTNSFEISTSRGGSPVS